MTGISALLAAFLLQAGEPSVRRLDAAHQPFREDIAASDGRARLIAILSPT